MTVAIGIKRAGIALGAVFVAGAGSLLLLSFLMPAETVREAVKAEIRAVTGLEPVLRGDASVSLFPTGKVSFEDVSLSDNRTGKPALTAEHVVARLRFFPLLVGRIEIADVLLQRPTITIVFNADRSSNWSGHVETLARNLQAEQRQTTSFSEIRIENGTIILRDESYKIVETLSSVELSLAWPSISKSFAATGRFTWHNEKVDATISFTDFLATLRGDRSGLKVRLAGAPLKFGFDGYLSHRPTLKIEGALAADTSSLRETLRWTGAQPPPGGGFGRFALKAQTNVVGGTIGLSGVHIELDGNTGEGVLTLATDGRRTLQGTLATELLDLSPYVSTVRLMASGERGWDRKPLAVEGFSGLDVDLRLSAARVVVSSVKLGRTAVAANLRGNHLSVAVGESEAFGGVVKGTFGLARSSSGADLKAQMQFANIDLDQSLGEMFGFRRLEGKGNLSFAIESSGSSVYDLNSWAQRHCKPRQPQGRDLRHQRRAVAQAHGAQPALARQRISHRQDALRYAQREPEDHARHRHRRGYPCRGPDRAPRIGRFGIHSGPRPRLARHREPGLDNTGAGVRAAVHGARRVGRPGHAAGRPELDRTVGRRAAATRRAAQEHRARCNPVGDREIRCHLAVRAAGNAAAGNGWEACSRSRVCARRDRKPAGDRAQACRRA